MIVQVGIAIVASLLGHDLERHCPRLTMAGRCLVCGVFAIAMQLVARYGFDL